MPINLDIVIYMVKIKLGRKFLSRTIWLWWIYLNKFPPMEKNVFINLNVFIYKIEVISLAVPVDVTM